MRTLLITFLVSALWACSSQQPALYNESTVEIIEETLNLRVASREQALKRSMDFIYSLKKRERNIRVNIVYRPDMSELMNDLISELTNMGITRNHLEMDITDSGESSDLAISVYYKRYSGFDCGELSFRERNAYRFGCALEFNRNMSLVNGFGE